MKSVAENIRKFREAERLSPQELARRITVTKKNVADWECGTAQPDLETLKLIAAALDVNIMELIYGKCELEFLRERPQRVKTTITLAAVFVVCLTADHILCHSGTIEQPYILYHAILTPATYASGAAALASFLAIWYNFSISSRILRESLFSLGAVFIATYYLDFYLQSVYKIHLIAGICLSNYPVLLILPGTLFFLGRNKPPSK